MSCPNTKRKFEEVEQAVHSCLETLTGYEKCLLQNKLLLARSRMVKYEKLAIIYEAQVSMAKLDVEIATSDIDLLLQELQRGKRFKTGEAITTQSASTQTNSPPPSIDTSRISLELPSVDLTFKKHRADGSQEPGKSQRGNARESTSQKENAQDSTSSQEENSRESTSSQGSKDSGYNASPKCLISQETQVDLPSVNTKEGYTEIVKTTKKCYAKKVSDTENKSETSKNEKLKSKKDKNKNKDTPICEKPKVNEELSNINETAQKIDSARRRSFQRRHSQDNRHRKRDVRKSDSFDRRTFTDSQYKNTDRYDPPKNKPKRRKATNERKSSKEKFEAFIEKPIPDRNEEGIKPKTRRTSRSQYIANNRKGSDEKSDKRHQDNNDKEVKKSKPELKSNGNGVENTDPIIKKNYPITAKYKSDKVKNYSKKFEDRSCESTPVAVEKTIELETTLPKQRIDSETFDTPLDSPIHYTDFENTILSSVVVSDASYVSRNTTGGLNSQKRIAQSTPFVRRITTLRHSGSECEDLPIYVCSDPFVEDQLNTFIRTTLADYNKDVTELNVTPDTLTIIDKDTNTNVKKTIRDKTTYFNDENTAIDGNTKVNDKTTNINEENACQASQNSQTPEKMTKSTPKQNLMVKIPITKVPAAINHINPTVIEIPIDRVTTSSNQPCLTVTVNDAGVITIRPKSAENSNLPSPKLDKTQRQNTQDISVNSTTVSISREPIVTAKQILNSQDDPSSNDNVGIPTETTSFMSQVKNQYYFDVDSPKLADEAPTHRNAVSLFRAFSLLMPPSPTFTVSSSSDKENCKSKTPSPPTVQKLPINKELLDDFVPCTYSHRNYITTSYNNDIHACYKNDIHTNNRNDNNTNSRNDINTNNRNDIHTYYKNDINTSHRNYINTRFKNDIHTCHKNDNNTSYKNDIHTSYWNDTHITHRKKIINNIYNNQQPMPPRRVSVADTIPRRTIKFTDAQPLPVRKNKTVTKPKNRRKSLDDRAILRILNDPCSSFSSKSGSRKSITSTPKKGPSLIDYLS